MWPLFYLPLNMPRTSQKTPTDPNYPLNGKAASKNGEDNKYTGESLHAEFHTAKNSMQQFRTKWEDFLDTAYARLVNQAGFKSRVREGTLSNLLWERSARVVSQLPTGRIQALEKDDIGKSKLMDLVWHKYVMSGANTDYSFFTKLRMWDYYSMVYGACPAFYDYRVDDEYTGPDWSVMDPRYVFPQAGRLSVQRCQFVFVEAYHNKEYVKSKVGVANWNTNNLNKILAEWKDGAQPDNSRRMTNLQNDRGQSIDLHRGEIQLVTKYERGKSGHWVTFAPQYDNMVVRDIPNPHKSGRIPVVFKFCFPLLDSIWGMGDVERGQSLQNAVDSFVNLSMDFAKFKLYPPMWYTNDVQPSQLRYEPAAKWKLPNGQDSAGFMQVSGNYSQEFTNGYQFLKGALMNQNGTTDTRIGADGGDTQQGKTPEAIQENSSKENARDNWDRSMLEEAYEELANGMINLIGTKQPKSIEFHIFDDDIKSIYESGNKDVIEVFSSAKKPKITDDGELDWELNGKGAAKLTLGPGDLKGAYRYMIDPGTTMAADDEDQLEHYEKVFELMQSPVWPQFVQGLQQDGRNFDYGNFAKQYFIDTGIENWEDILPETANQTNPGAKPFDPSMLKDPQALAAWQQQGDSQSPMDPQAMQQQAQQQQQQAEQQAADMQKQIEDKATELAKQMIAKMPTKRPEEMIAYKDASPLTKAHMEAAAGFEPDPIHQLEEQALMAGHAATTVNHNLDMQTPRQDPNAVDENGNPIGASSDTPQQSPSQPPAGASNG